MHTPSTESTSTSAPSHRREAVETSLEKSTCPGVSMSYIGGMNRSASPHPTLPFFQTVRRKRDRHDRETLVLTLIMKSCGTTSPSLLLLNILKPRLTAELSMVIPRSTSSSRLSR